jgi:hypothetical protein
MSDYSGTIKHPLHVTCKSQNHTSCVASTGGIRGGKARESDDGNQRRRSDRSHVRQTRPACRRAEKRWAQPGNRSYLIDHRTPIDQTTGVVCHSQCRVCSGVKNLVLREPVRVKSISKLRAGSPGLSLESESVLFARFLQDEILDTTTYATHAGLTASR